MLITVTDFIVEDDRLVDGDYIVRFAATGGEFVDSGGVHRPQLATQDVPASAVGGVLTAPPFLLAVTTDATLNQFASYTVTLIGTGTNQRFTMLLGQGIYVPWTNQAGYTWAELKLFAGAQNPWRDNDTYTKTETIREIDIRVAALVFPDATTLVKGKSRLSVASVLATDPIAVGDNDPRVGVDSADYASLAAAVTAIGATPTKFNLTNALPSGGSCTVPPTLRIAPLPGGSIVLGAGHAVVINSSARAWPVAQVFSGSGTVTFGSRIKLLNLEWWGAVPDDLTTDYSAAINACFTAARHVTASKTVKLRGMYRIDSTAQIGVSGTTRTTGFKLKGGGDGTGFKWYGDGSSPALKTRNFHRGVLEDFSITRNATGASVGLWLDVEDGGSSSDVRTRDLSLEGHTVGMLIGGGLVGSSGQANAFVHHSIHLDNNVTGVKITGANTECQTFTNLTGAGDLQARWFHLLNGRGLYIDGGDIAMNSASFVTEDFIYVEGSGAFGANVVVRNLRAEGLHTLVNFNPGNVLPINITADNIYVAVGATGGPSTTDFIKTNGCSANVSVRDSHLRAPGTRFSFLNLDADKYVSLTLENCTINNNWSAGVSPPDVNPYNLINATRTGVSAGDDGGVTSYLRGNLLTVVSGAFQPRIRMEDRTIVMTDSDITAGTYKIVDGNGNTGKQIGTVGTRVKNLLHGSATFVSAATVAVAFSALPSATYRVVLGGNVNETFWVTSKTTTGFTLNSSNATSTAVVDWQVLR